MSEFECRNGHSMKGTTCSKCGAGVYRMDGMTDSEIIAQEKYLDKKERREKKEEENDDG